MGLGPLPPAPNVLRVAIGGMKSFEPWLNVLHFAWGGVTPSVPTLHTMATDINNAWHDWMQGWQTHDTAMTQIKLTDLTSDLGAQVEDTFNLVGFNGEDPLPSSVALLVDYPVALRYRGGHPRTYLVVGGDGDLNTGGGNWDAWNLSFLGHIATAWTGFLNQVEAITVSGTNLGELTCVRYIHNGAYIIPPIQLGISGFLVSQQVASQRRRIGRRR